MTDVSTIDRPRKIATPKLGAVEAGIELVSGYKLAAHLGLTRQGVDALAAQGVLTRQADGMFNQTSARLAYLKHLKTERRGSANMAAQAEHAKQKARLLELRIRREERELMTVADHNTFVDGLAGVLLTGLSSLPARLAPHDLAARRRAEAIVRELRTEIANACLQRADDAEADAP